MASGGVFCGIVREPERAEQVFADEHTVAFLDHRPLFPGHVLVPCHRTLAQVLGLRGQA